MAIYHFSAQVLGRVGKRNPDGSPRPGSNAVAAAAYRSGERLTDREGGKVHDYSRRKGVVHSEVLAPPGSAPWLEDRELLWNTVEALEKRKDAQLAREFNMALPHELTHDQRLELVRGFVDRQFVQRGMVADLALHDPMPEQGQHRHNFHAHVMLTLRRATPSGLDPVKTREWNSKELMKVWRAEWALACNGALERAGKQVKIDHRTLQAQRDAAVEARDFARAAELNRQPEIHVGPKARQVVRHERAPTSQARPANAPRRPAPERAPQRRVRDYPVHDRGTRVNWLESILIGNNERLRQTLQNTNRRMDRLNRKLDYWERKAVFHLEGKLRGKEFRFQRWKVAQDAKTEAAERAAKVAHARKRIAQIRSLLGFLESLSILTGRRRELGLRRSREIEGWMRELRRGRRGPSRSQGRTRTPPR